LQLILLIAFAVALSSVREVTLRIPIQPGPRSEEIAVVTFDADRVSAEDVKKWMLLHENAYYHLPMFSYYPECKPSDLPKLEQDIKKTEQKLKDLDSNNYPPELTDVVRYLRDLQSFRLWQAKQELEFLKSGKLPDSEYSGLDLRICQVPTSGDRSQACHQVFIGWHNCVLNRMMKRLGSYPKERWKTFLDSFGIQERIESEVE
jgi:hypothetical protein